MCGQIGVGWTRIQPGRGLACTQRLTIRANQVDLPGQVLPVDDDLDHIDRLLEESKAAVKQGDVDKFLETEIAFHNILTQSAQNRRLISIMDSLGDLTYRWRIISLKSQENVRLTLIEHQAIAQALRQRDGLKAGKLMGDHIRSASERMIEEIDLDDELEMHSGPGA